MRAFVVAAAVVFGVAVASAWQPALASAATVNEPRSPVGVTLDADGHPVPFTVKAGGFQPYENVFIEQCNGRPPSADHWAPSLDCDLGSAPAAAVADTDGNVTFAAADPNHALYVFVGPSPQGLFNCLAPPGKDPGNGMPSFSSCQVRISTSNNEGTADQVFLTVSLPKGAKDGAGKPTMPVAAANPTQQSGSQSDSKQSGSKAADSGAGATTEAASSTSSSSSGSSSSVPVAGVLLAIAAAGIGGAFFLLHKRRSGRVAA